MTAFIWLILIILAAWVNHIQRQSQIDNIRSQVTLVNSRIISMYENNNDPRAFFDFVRQYYIQNPLYDEIRLTIYYNGEIIYEIGEPIDAPDSPEARASGLIPAEQMKDTREERRRVNFFYDEMESPDHRIQVYCIIPFSADILEATRASKSLFLFVLMIAIVATVFSNVMARRLAKNIEALRDFARSASVDPNFIPSSDFSNDEFGEIARDIVNFHNTRTQNIRKLKREHEVAIHALEEKTHLKRELTNNLSHELKTPVGVIKGYLDTIRDHPEMDPDALKHFLNKMSQHVDRLVQFLEDLSSINRLEYGSQMINTEPVDFHEIAFQSVSDLETSGIMGQMEINYDIPTTCRVIGNESLLSGMIANLAKNAAAYSKGTECNLVLVDEDAETFTFEFYDNGMGVKEESIPHLFERFFREDTGRSRKKGGTGLGLCIVQNTVEALGGTIEAYNRKEGGLAFRFTLRKPKNRN
ncbi:MAG: HAMP domain-containing histidine kinase [Muribaculaceae bacterium]|nr:HAMP domain-containing histidine kinase [Muribaculaceae bacterium]